MKTLFWTNRFPTFSETFIRDQIIALLDENIDVLVFSNLMGDDEKEALKGFEKYQLLKRRIDFSGENNHKFKRIIKALYILILSCFKGHFKYYVASLNWGKYGRQSKTLRLFFQVNYILKYKVNVIHAHFGPNGLKAVPLKEIGLPVKLFTTFHGYDIRLGINNGGEMYNDLFKYSDGIFSISKFNYENLLNFGASKKILKPLSNGIDISFFNRRNTININGKLKIITVARLVKEKSITTAIETISMLSLNRPDLEIEYSIIGEGDLHFALEELINSLKLSKKIKLLGAKNSIEVRDLMISSDMFLLTSIAEALPTVLLEAQSSKLVILATDVGSVRDMVKGGLVVPHSNVKELYLGMLQLLEERQYWNELAEKGRKYVETYHNIKTQAQKTIQIYND